MVQRLHLTQLNNLNTVCCYIIPASPDARQVLAELPYITVHISATYFTDYIQLNVPAVDELYFRQQIVIHLDVHVVQS